MKFTMIVNDVQSPLEGGEATGTKPPKNSAPPS